MGMKITKIISNNTVVTVANGREIILTGAGIGFGKKAGDPVDVKRIEKVYQIRDRWFKRYEQIYKHIKPEYFQVAENIRIMAEKELLCALSPQFVFSLADHIAYAIERQEKKEPMPNLMLHEIRLLYEKEYRIGKWGKELLEKEIGRMMPIDEAGYFALHIVNAKTEEASGDVTRILVLTNGILKIVHENMNVRCRESDFEYNRFLMHLKFLAKRIFERKPDELNVIENMYPELIKREPALEVVIPKIRTFIREMFGYEISDEEATYLSVHIIRITKA